MSKPKKKHLHLTPVTVRLFTEDVEELKRRAEEAGELGWQPRLRKLVRDGLRGDAQHRRIIR